MRATEPLALIVEAELDEWRTRVDRFLAEQMEPTRWAAHVDERDLTGLDVAFERAHHRAAAAEGFLAVSVPASLGGGGRPRHWKLVYDFLAAWHDAPSIDTGVTLCAAPLALFGTPAQHERWLAPMVAGEMLACVAYTEDGAGNDLARLTTEARRDGEGWRLSGAKALVTGAHKADVALVLARTSPTGPPRASMGMFLVPMDAAGIHVARRETINGWTLEDITFNDVALGGDALLGREGEGWSQVMGALEHERGSLAHLGWSARRLHDLPEAVDPLERARLVVDYGRAVAFAQRLLDRSAADESGGPDASAVKVVSTETLARIARAAGSAAGGAMGGDRRMDTGPRHAFDTREWIHPMISVGANETHRDMIAAAIVDCVLDPPTSAADGDPLLDRCREMAHIAAAAWETARRRIGEREVFGRPIADFQVARHRLVDMYLAVDAMVATIDDVARRSGDDRERARSIAKVICNEGVVDVCLGAHQLHGGAGYLATGPLEGLVRRAWELQPLEGTTDDHLRALVD